MSTSEELYRKIYKLLKYVGPQVGEEVTNASMVVLNAARKSESTAGLKLMYRDLCTGIKLTSGNLSPEIDEIVRDCSLDIEIDILDILTKSEISDDDERRLLISFVDDYHDDARKSLLIAEINDLLSKA